jgi:hypothetical protein
MFPLTVHLRLLLVKHGWFNYQESLWSSEVPAVVQTAKSLLKNKNVMSYDNHIILYHTISIYIPMTLFLLWIRSVTWLGNSIRSSLAPHLKRNMNIATVRSLMTTSSILIIWRCLNGSLKWDSSSSVGSWCFFHIFQTKWQTQIIGWVTQTKHIQLSE